MPPEKETGAMMRRSQNLDCGQRISSRSFSQIRWAGRFGLLAVARQTRG